MIDLTRLRIGDFHDRVAAAVPCVPDDDETRAALRGRRLADVLGVFLNHHGRFVPARPRNVDYAADFWTSQAVRVEADIAALEGRIKRGEDLGPYMSPNIGRNGFVASNGRQRWEPARDLALNAFGVHHLHLTPGKGSDALAFIAFSRIAAVFVMLGPHKSFDDGSLADAVARYQAQTGREIKSAWPSGTTPSPRDQMKLARRCVSSFGNADGKLTVGARNHRRSCSQTEPDPARISCQRGRAHAHITCLHARHHHVVLANRRVCPQSLPMAVGSCPAPLMYSHSSGLGVLFRMEQFLPGDLVAGDRRLSRRQGQPVGELLRRPAPFRCVLVRIECDHVVAVHEVASTLHDDAQVALVAEA